MEVPRLELTFEASVHRLHTDVRARLNTPFTTKEKTTFISGQDNFRKTSLSIISSHDDCRANSWW